MSRSSQAGLLGLTLCSHKLGKWERTEARTEALIGPTTQRLPTQLRGVGWFLGDAPPEHPLIEGSGCSIWGAGVGPEAIVGPPC